MNKGRFKKLAIASISAIALAGSIAVAQTVTTDQNTQQGSRMEHRGGRGKHGGRGWGGMRAGGFFRQLNLTEDQKAKMKSDPRELRRKKQTPARTASCQATGVASGERRRYVQRSTGYSETNGNGEP